MPPSIPGASRPLRTWLALGLPLALIVLLLVFEPTRLDFALSDLFYQPGVGFSGGHSAFLEDFLHDRAKQGVIVIGVLAIAGLLASWLYRPWAALRRPFGYLVLAMALSTAIVNPVKTLTGVHCPWSLTQYGGEETYSPLLGERAPVVDKAGRCWPGGHASSGFTLFALYFVLRDRKPRLARAALLFALTLGTVFSVGRVMQGAHFLSHNVWTALFDWLICLGFYRLILYRQAQTTAPALATLPLESRS
ncbi:phosphatase PAP2 family protein [Pseudomonas sp. MAP12]|uniref:Phosphatase PAP2 family protein n=1 Tax=Geopseudomonas aromaticivorans TaxID=2849492 RepID=A0ABS6MZY9_9GAMM|nr:phosphatase PAP2 family protein [Pseudomonas aromaticivorans]MBV2134379.1 phosphatase PAP2 family protein [Pseudomonas aromaticivorans]